MQVDEKSETVELNIISESDADRHVPAIGMVRIMLIVRNCKCLFIRLLLFHEKARPFGV